MATNLLSISAQLIYTLLSTSTRHFSKPLLWDGTIVVDIEVGTTVVSIAVGTKEVRSTCR